MKTGKKPMTIWVDPTVHKAVTSLAAAHHLSVSQVAANLLANAVDQHANTAGTQTIIPALEAAIDRAFRKNTDRIANLLARTGLEAASTRRMIYQQLHQSLGDETAKRISSSAWNASVESLKKPSEGVREILASPAFPAPE